jgi:peptidyl-prolyl cis-trans isomerase SurA
MSRLYAALVACVFLALYCGVVEAQYALQGIAAEVKSGGQKDVITFSQVREVAGPKEKEATETLKGMELVEKIKEIRAAAIKELIDRTLALHQFKAAGRTVPDSFLDRRIERIIRRDFGGDPAALTRALRDRGQTWEQFRNHEREEIALEEMRRDVTHSTANVEEAQRLESEWLKKLRKSAYIKVY